MAKWLTGDFDDFETYMKAGSAGELGKEHGLEQVGFWNKILAHPSYDAFWSDQAVDKVLAQYYEHAPMIPTMLVASLWDQEDIYGAIAVYKAIKPLDKNGDLHLVIGPWHHGQEIGDGSSLGAIHFNSDTGLFFRQHILRPFLAKYLMDDAPATEVPAVWAFKTGTDEWERLASWPSGLSWRMLTPTGSAVSDLRTGAQLHRAVGFWSRSSMLMFPIRRNRCRIGGVRRSPLAMFCR